MYPIVQKQLADSVDGFVIDLRNNPGSLLDISVDIASVFVDDEVIVSREKVQEFKQWLG